MFPLRCGSGASLPLAKQGGRWVNAILCVMLGEGLICEVVAHIYSSVKCLIGLGHL